MKKLENIETNQAQNIQDMFNVCSVVQKRNLASFEYNHGRTTGIYQQREGVLDQHNYQHGSRVLDQRGTHTDTKKRKKLRWSAILSERMPIVLQACTERKSFVIRIKSIIKSELT